MPELGPYGSVRGARGNSRPYRDPRSKADMTLLNFDVRFTPIADIAERPGMSALCQKRTF